jgi:hypothetical protein
MRLNIGTTSGLKLNIGSAMGVLDAYNLLKSRVPIYIASSSTPNDTMQFRGAWRDDDGNIHFDYSGVFLDYDLALETARLYNQECILALYPSPSARGRLYLLPDTPLNRQIALETAGGYTADGKYLITAVSEDVPVPFSAIDCLPVRVEFPTCQ